jgi:hypothetical protein
LHIVWLAYDLFELWLNINLYLFTLLRMMGWGVYHFCSGVLVVTRPLNFFNNFEIIFIILIIVFLVSLVPNKTFHLKFALD